MILLVVISVVASYKILLPLLDNAPADVERNLALFLSPSHCMCITCC